MSSTGPSSSPTRPRSPYQRVLLLRGAMTRATAMSSSGGTQRVTIRYSTPTTRPTPWSTVATTGSVFSGPIRRGSSPEPRPCPPRPSPQSRQLCNPKSTTLDTPWTTSGSIASKVETASMASDSSLWPCLERKTCILVTEYLYLYFNVLKNLRKIDRFF